jgi:hypothetical protein
MKARRLFCLLAAMLVSVVVSRAGDYSGVEAAKHIGEQAAVTDRVDDVHEAKGNIFVNMGGRHPNEAFTAFIPSKSAKDFPDIKECKGLTLTISGKIQDHQGKPEIVVTSPSQISRKDNAASKTSPPIAASTPAEPKPPAIAPATPVQTKPLAAPQAASAETIMLTQPVQVKLKYGVATLPAGLTLPIVGGDADGIVVEYAGEKVTLPPR